jgi:hypothetical protein
MRALIRLTVACLLTAPATVPGQGTANWSANYSQCDGHSELLNKTRLNLGVRFSTSNPQLAAQCARALDFWATVLDMEWHEDDSRSCAIQVVDGRRDLFIPGQLARAAPGTVRIPGVDCLQPQDQPARKRTVLCCSA